ncbi:MAG: amidohydrolase [Gammaproteobacteria bacterium]|nr:amidohydrolase [Gammaproteobacteria bacterium]
MNVDKTILLTFVFHLALSACQNETGAPEAPGSRAPADAVYYGGKIYTLDDRRSWAEAVAVKDGRFLAVGNNADMLALAGAETEKYDLNGAMALPGLHDAHFHYLSVTNALDCTPGPFKPEQLRETLEYCKTRRVEGYPWVLINNMEMWGDSPLSNDLLNEVFPDTPVLIRDVTMHTRLVNARALEIAGIDRDTEPPEGGVIVKHPQTGVLAEVSAIWLVRAHIPPYPRDLVKAALEDLSLELLAAGLTSVQDAFSFDRDMLEMLGELDRAGRPMPYIHLHHGWNPEGGPGRQAQEAQIADRAKYATPHISSNGIKLFLDGVPVPPVFTHVPIGADGEVDETNLLIPRDVLARKITEWDRAGLRVKMHAAGDGAVRVGLDAIEAVRKANGDSGIWHEIGHTSDVSETDLPRFAELYATAEMSPYFWSPGSILGSDGYQFRSLHGHGALITVGSDYAVVESFNPFPPIQGIVQRGDESLPVETALEFYTRNPARVSNNLDNMGSIEAGKTANMIVIDRNILEIPSKEIGATQVLKTILDGKVVYEKP